MFLKKNITNSFSILFVSFFLLPLIIVAKNYDQVFFSKKVLLFYCIFIIFFFFIFKLINLKFLNNFIFQSLIFFIYLKFFFNSLELKFDGSKNLIEDISYLKVLALDIFFLVIAIFLSLKLKKREIYNLNIILLIFLFVNILVNSNFLIDKRNKTFNNTFSSEKNIILLVLDGFDANFFNYQINEDFKESKKIFKDFTYHKNTVANFFFSEYSVPSYLSGTIFRKNEDYNSYIKLNKNKILKLNPNFEKRFVLPKRICTLLNLTNCIDRYNLTLSNKNKNLKSFFDIFDVYFTKIIPVYFIKKDNEVLNKIISREKFSFLSNHFSSNPLSIDFLFKKKISEDLKIKKETQFIYYHFALPHYPGEFDRNCIWKDDPNLRSLKWIDVYTQSVCIVKIIEEFFNFLKKNNLYDNSMILVLGDHGTKNKPTIYRKFLTEPFKNFPPAQANPVFLTKNFFDKQNVLLVDEKLKSLAKLRDYINLMMNNERINNIQERNVTVNYFQEFGRRSENEIWEQFQINGKVYDSTNWIPVDILKFDENKISKLDSKTAIYNEYLNNKDSFSLYGWKEVPKSKSIKILDSASFYFHKLNYNNKLKLEILKSNSINCKDLEIEIFNRGKNIFRSKLENNNIILNDKSFFDDYNLIFLRTNKNLQNECIEIKNIHLI
jgi:hypothetical protein